MTKEATPAPRKAEFHKESRAVRLPVYDSNTGEMLRQYLEIDVDFFLSSTSGLRANQARIVEFEEYPDPTPEQEIDIIDRIISGLPMEYSKPANPKGNAVYEKEPKKLYDVNSLYPEEFRLTPNIKLTHERRAEALIAAADTWELIPDFENYQINPLGVIRSRWTKRVLEVAEDGDQKYVAMHDSKGYAHDVNVAFAMEKTYGK